MVITALIDSVYNLARASHRLIRSTRLLRVRVMDRDKESKDNNSIIFSGNKVEDWFKFDRQVLRWVRKTYGDSGVKMWNETAIVIDAQSVDAIAQDTYECIAEREGLKDADRYYD